MGKVCCVFASLLLLAGCVAPEPVISDLQTDKVRVQYQGSDRDKVMSKAHEGCWTYKRTPKPISYRCLDQYCIAKEYLFACVQE